MFSETHAWTCSSCVMGTGTCAASKGVVGLGGFFFFKCNGPFHSAKRFTVQGLRPSGFHGLGFRWV